MTVWRSSCLVYTRAAELWREGCLCDVEVQTVTTVPIAARDWDLTEGNQSE